MISVARNVHMPNVDASFCCAKSSNCSARMVPASAMAHALTHNANRLRHPRSPCLLRVNTDTAVPLLRGWHGNCASVEAKAFATLTRWHSTDYAELLKRAEV